MRNEHLATGSVRYSSYGLQAPGTGSIFFADARGYMQGLSVVAFCLAGTGGMMTPDTVAARDAKGYRLPALRYVESTRRESARRARTAAECLARVKEVLRPSVTELAGMFGISRQAIYNWQAGQPVHEENLTKLNSLASLADAIRLNGIDAAQAKRKLPGGRTAVEIVLAGESPLSAVQQLNELLHSERVQRATMEARHGAAGVVNMAGAGVPYFHEGT